MVFEESSPEWSAGPAAKQPELLPGRPSFYVDKLIVSGMTYLNTYGYPVTVETVRDLSGNLQRSIQFADYAGHSTTEPNQDNGYTIEGNNFDTRKAFAVVERDEYGRPIHVVSHEIARNIEGMIDLSMVLDKADQPAQKTKFDEIVDGYMVDEEPAEKRQELFFQYDSQNGLLHQIVLDAYSGSERTYHSIFENCYDDHGRRTGYIRSHSTQVEEGLEEEHVVEVGVIYMSPQRWQAVSYVAHEDGLIPYSVIEGDGSVPFTNQDVDLQRPMPPHDQVFYQLALEPLAATLQENGSQDPDRSIELPSWIPLTARYAIASQRLSLHEAAAAPPIEAYQDADILYCDEARLQLPGLKSDSQIAEFINSIRARTIVILQTEGVQRKHQFKGISQGVAYFSIKTMAEAALANNQKLAAIATLHQAMSRTNVVPEDLTIARYDQRALFLLFESMQYSSEQFRESIRSLEHLFSDDARAAFQYLSGLSDLQIKREEE